MFPKTKAVRRCVARVHDRAWHLKRFMAAGVSTGRHLKWLWIVGELLVNHRHQLVGMVETCWDNSGHLRFFFRFCKVNTARSGALTSSDKTLYLAAEKVPVVKSSEANTLNVIQGKQLPHVYLCPCMCKNERQANSPNPVLVLKPASTLQLCNHPQQIGRDWYGCRFANLQPHIRSQLNCASLLTHKLLTKIEPNSKVRTVLGKVTLSRLWVKPVPSVKLWRPLGKVTRSRLWLK
jgi:hypothetical protein